MTKTAIALVLGLMSAVAAGQQYPARSVRFIVPYAAGGGTDIVARLVARQMSEALGQQVVVDNRGGVGGIVGTELASKAPPDGYTLLMGTTGSIALNVSLYPKLPYDALRDFEPVSLVSIAPHIVAVHPSVPAKSVKELIAYARANPGKLTFSSSGGSSLMSGEMLKVMAKVDMLHVAYRGVGPAAVAAITGEVSVTFSDVIVLLPHVKAGKLRGLAVTGARRSPAAPELPTVAEAGPLPGYESGVWYGVMVPARTPPEIIARLNAAVVRAVQHPELRDRLLAEGSTIVGGSPEQFGEYIRTEQRRWGHIVKAANIKAE